MTGSTFDAKNPDHVLERSMEELRLKTEFNIETWGEVDH